MPRKTFLGLLANAIFIGLQALAVVSLFLFPPTWGRVALAIGLFYVGMFATTAAYHRYFSHRSYKTSRVFQFLLAWLAQTTTQKGVLWWAAHHRRHHKFSDRPEDVHSPIQRGFFWAHIGWILSDDFTGTDTTAVKDLAKFPEIRWLNRHHLVPPLAYVGVLFLAGGWSLVAWAYVIPVTVLFHGTFLINSLAHVWGRRVYETSDDSRNNGFLALITMGEGWHNNHHHYQASSRQGFLWYQVDPTFYVLKALSWVGLVWDLKTPPQKVLDQRMTPVRPFVPEPDLAAQPAK